MGTAGARPESLDWLSNESHVLENPRWTPVQRDEARRVLAGAPRLEGHLWVQSSGSSRGPGESAKWIALSKRAFLAAAEGANRHLGAESADRWGVALPLFHVGGLAILARAFLSGSSISFFAGDWNAPSFAGWLAREKVTLLSLVPTQLHDLTEDGGSESSGLRAPAGLRVIIVGGAKLEDSLREKAWSRGWPALPSFGMTEMCSQVATARGVGDPSLRLLPHVEARTDGDGSLWLRSPALFTGFAQERGGEVIWTEPDQVDGFWRSPDRARLTGDVLTPLGRASDYVKVRGEGVNLQDLRERFAVFARTGFAVSLEGGGAIAAVADDRTGHRLVAAVETGHPARASLLRAVTAWNSSCFPVERLDVQEVSRLPRSDLGKILWKQLETELRSRPD